MKDQIVNKAIELFLQYGFKSVTIDDLAIKMSISKKTIYSYFQTKEELVETSVMRHFNEITNKIIHISKYSKDPIIELYQIKKEALKHLSNEKDSPVYQLQKYYNNIYQKMNVKEFKVIRDIFSKSLKKGIEMELFRQEININFVTRIFFNGLRGIKDLELFPVEEFKIDHLLISFSEYHLHAICTPKGIEKLNNYKKELNI